MYHMREPISDALRLQVAERAERHCEYCLIFEDDTHFGCQIDHIISIKHGGDTTLDNLTYACAFCNRAKGSDVGSIISETNTFVRLYNPRIDIWADHFELDGVVIKTKSDIGRIIAQILKFNDYDRVLERETLHAVGAYPSIIAMKYIS